jgi:hypothetical protein
MFRRTALNQCQVWHEEDGIFFHSLDTKDWGVRNPEKTPNFTNFIPMPAKKQSQTFGEPRLPACAVVLASARRTIVVG